MHIARGSCIPNFHISRTGWMHYAEIWYVARDPSAMRFAHIMVRLHLHVRTHFHNSGTAGRDVLKVGTTLVNACSQSSGASSRMLPLSAQLHRSPETAGPDQQTGRGPEDRTSKQGEDGEEGQSVQGGTSYPLRRWSGHSRGGRGASSLEMRSSGGPKSPS